MNNITKTILNDWQKKKLPEIIKRQTKLTDYLDLKVNKIVTVSGFRRIGKTYLIFDLIKKLLKNNKKNDIVYLNFEDERIPQKTEFLTRLLPTIKQTFGRLPKFLFLDEVQNIPNWSKWLRRIFDNENIKFFVTGSSSKLSNQEIPTELRGRCLEVKIYSLSFKEFLNFKKVKIDFKNLDYSETEKAKIFYNLEEYLFYGGMPEVVLSDESKKQEILQQYFATVLRRDIVERFKIKNEEALKSLCQLLLNSTIFSASRLQSNLKSSNLKVGKATLIKYLNYLENSYFLSSVPIFSYKIKNQLQYPRKNYFIDNGFINALSLKFSKDHGRLFENLVFLELKRKFSKIDIFYWQDKQQKEVDFVIKQGLKIKYLIQVCYDLSFLETKKREINSLLKASQELKCNNLIIITNTCEAEEKISGRYGKNKKIKFIPLWKWILDLKKI